MITIDTLKIDFPLSAIKSVNRSAKWQNNMSADIGTGEIKYDYDFIDFNQLGLKRIEINRHKEKATLELSSKCLKENYFNLISRNTFEQMIKSVNDTGVINLDKNQVYDYADFRRADFCNNLIVENDVNLYFPQLLGISANDKYKLFRHNTKHNQGITIMGKQKSFKERMIFYNKMLDINKDKELLKEVRYSTLQNQFNNCLRIEQNSVQKARIRHYIGSQDTLFKTILESESAPNYMLLQKASTKFVSLDLFSEYSDLKLYEIEKRIGRETIIKKCNYDIELINEFISKKVKGNVSQYKTEYKEILAELNDKRGLTLLPKDNIYLNEILTKLKSA